MRPALRPTASFFCLRHLILRAAIVFGQSRQGGNGLMTQQRYSSATVWPVSAE